jgi:hypothetical protein
MVPASCVTSRHRCRPCPEGSRLYRSNIPSRIRLDLQYFSLQLLDIYRRAIFLGITTM